MSDSTLPKKHVAARAGQSVKRLVCDDLSLRLHANSDALYFVRLFARAASEMAHSCNQRQNLAFGG